MTSFSRRSEPYFELKEMEMVEEIKEDIAGTDELQDVTENTDMDIEAADEIPAEDVTVEADAAAADDEKKAEAGNVKKGLFGRKPDKRDEQIKELQDKYTRQLAEFENFRKRNELEKSKMFEVGMREVIEKLLPIVDNFERGLKLVPEDKKDDAFVVGMEQVYKQIMTTLEELKVEPIAAVGESFDPNLHNAVMHEENEEYGENVIVEELMKGYKFRDTVVRYSMVKVAN